MGRLLPRLRAPDLDGWLLAEVGRARARIAALEEAHPGASRGELARRLVDEKKGLAVNAGMVTGIFGWVSIPADVAFGAWVQATLAIELAVLHGANLKGASGKADLLDVLGVKERPALFLLPTVAAAATRAMIRRFGWRALGRGVPFLASPLTAWANGRDIERVAEEATRRFATFRRVRTAR